MKEDKLSLQLYGSPLLRKKCREVKEIDFHIRQYFDKMVYMMRKKDGVGLAANQAGLDISLVVIETKEKLYKLVNPKILKSKGKILFDEGCLSFPGLGLTVKRSRQVWVNYLDDSGRSIDLQAEGVLAVILQHEIDHINGVVFIDRVPFFTRLKIRPQLLKIKKMYKAQHPV